MSHDHQSVSVEATSTHNLYADRKAVLEAMKNGSYSLTLVPTELLADREIALAAVSRNGYALKYVADGLQADREFVLAAVRQNGWALNYVSKKLRADRKIVLIAVKQAGCLLSFASDELRADREFVLAAVNRNGAALEYASAELRADRRIVLAAVGTYSPSLQFAGDSSRNDPVIIAEAIQSSSWKKSYPLKLGSELKRRLRLVLQRMITERDISFVDDSSILEYCMRWEQSTWHKIWLVSQLVKSGTDGYARCIFEDANLFAELQWAKELTLRSCYWSHRFSWARLAMPKKL